MSYSEKLKHPKWQKKRLEILQRDNFECKFCGDNENTLHVHHISYNGENPWEIDNKLLITLCEECHEHETGAIKAASSYLVSILKSKGFTSNEFSELAGAFECTNVDLTNRRLIFAAIFHKLSEENFIEDLEVEYWSYLKDNMPDANFIDEQDIF